MDARGDEAASSDSGAEGTGGVRLQKVLAEAGLASRRASELLIGAGRVEVNGQVITQQGTRVDPLRDVIRVDGARIPPPRRHAYLAFNKPLGVVCTMSDPQGRPTITHYLGRRKDRLYHIGRLDTDTSGLLLLTNDGDFAHRLAHPSFAVTKVYVADVEGVVAGRVLRQLGKGVRLDDGQIAFDKVRVLDRAASRTLLELTLHSGRNRVVRRALEAVGHPVKELTRIAVGPVRLGQLAAGKTRELSREELGSLLDLTQL